MKDGNEQTCLCIILVRWKTFDQSRQQQQNLINQFDEISNKKKIKVVTYCATSLHCFRAAQNSQLE